MRNDDSLRFISFSVVMMTKQEFEHSLILIERSFNAVQSTDSSCLFQSNRLPSTFTSIQFSLSVSDHWEDWTIFVFGMTIVAKVLYPLGLSNTLSFVIFKRWRNLISFANDGWPSKKTMEWWVERRKVIRTETFVCWWIRRLNVCCLLPVKKNDETWVTSSRKKRITVFPMAIYGSRSFLVHRRVTSHVFNAVLVVSSCCSHRCSWTFSITINYRIPSPIPITIEYESVFSHSLPKRFMSITESFRLSETSSLLRWWLVS